MSLVADISDLTQEEYERVRKLVYAKSGINLGDQKMQLVRARLGKIIRQRGLRNYTEYLRMVEEDSSGEELCGLLDAISTNTTHLFREMRHFDLLRQLLTNWTQDASWRKTHSAVRIWSAASSSGEEPHSLAMVADDVLSRVSGVELKILATDISTQMLARAKRAAYQAHRLGTTPKEYHQRYFRKMNNGDPQSVQLIPELLAKIKFARFNLMTPSFPFQHGFDIVFCRNVMIYFDRDTQQTLVNKIAKHLRPGGHLMIGHSESLNNISHPLRYVEPTVYRK